MKSTTTLQLTPREKEIIQAWASGRLSHEIAAIHFISEHTVKQHIKNIYRKMGVKSKIQAALMYGMLQQKLAS
jgi:DNA-binding CsgD family transcriptional regulator